MSMQTLQSLVQRLPSFGSRQAVGLRREYGVRWWNYQRLFHESRRVAMLLGMRGLGRGDRLLLWAPNCPEWVAFLLGAMLRGVVVVPIDEDATIDYVRNLAANTGATLLIYNPAHDVSTLDVPTQSLYLPEYWLAPPAQVNLVVPVGPDDPALILFTSGTVQHPKGVILTHRNLAAQMHHFTNWRWLLRFVPVRMIVTAPLGHAQGLLLGICLPLSLGLSVIYTSFVDPPHLIRTIRHNRVTILATVPRVQHLLAKALRQMSMNRDGATLESRVRRVPFRLLRRRFLRRQTHAILGNWFWILFVGGAALPPDDEWFWREGRYILVQGYGLTETAAIVSVNGPLLGRKGSIGRPLAGQEIRIAEDGEILVRGANVTPGYYQDGVGEQLLSEDDFLRTGDLVGRDKANRLYFLGRKKDIIVTGEGHNVYPQEIEVIINRHVSVIDSVVLGMQRDGHEEVHAVLLLKPDADAAQIVRTANQQLAPHQRIRNWTIWPEKDFARTNLLKVRRAAVADYVRAMQAPLDSPLEHMPLGLEALPTNPDRGRQLQLIARYLTQVPADQSPNERIRLTEDLGLSSLDIVELLTLIEQRHAVDLDMKTVPAEATLPTSNRS